MNHFRVLVCSYLLITEASKVTGTHSLCCSAFCILLGFSTETISRACLLHSWLFCQQPEDLQKMLNMLPLSLLSGKLSLATWHGRYIQRQKKWHYHLKNTLRKFLKGREQKGATEGVFSPTKVMPIWASQWWTFSQVKHIFLKKAWFNKVILKSACCPIAFNMFVLCLIWWTFVFFTEKSDWS